MGIKRLVKQFKHMWLYHSHPCISAVGVCVCVSVCFRARLRRWYLHMPDGPVLALAFELIMAQRRWVETPHMRHMCISIACVSVCVCVLVCICA